MRLPAIHSDFGMHEPGSWRMSAIAAISRGPSGVSATIKRRTVDTDKLAHVTNEVKQWL